MFTLKDALSIHRMEFFEEYDDGENEVSEMSDEIFQRYSSVNIAAHQVIADARIS